MSTQTTATIDKGGRPPLWNVPVKRIRVPEEYADALLEIAREWLQNKGV